MATVKVKFRASSVPGKEGTLYYHLIHQRSLRWISTDYHVFPDEWNDKKSAIIVSNRNNRRKTHQNLNIEWMKPMQAIIDKYAEQTKDSPYLLPILTRKESSPYTAYRKVEHNTNYNLKKIGEMAGLKIPLTTYVARHTWASVALHMNITIATISHVMGHNSYKTTNIYLQSLDVATINEANKRIISKILKEL